MNTRIFLALALVLALAAPIAVSNATPGSQVEIAKKKKKLTWCQKKAKKEKVKYVAKNKSAKFFLYKKTRPAEYFFCSESPKYTGTIAEWGSGIKKTSDLRVVRNNCAVFYHEAKSGGTDYDADTKYLKYISAKYFRKGSKYPKQTQASRLGRKGEKVVLHGLALSKNCVAAVGYSVDGVPKLMVLGMGDFPSPQWIYDYNLAASGSAGLNNLKVSGSGASATVTWPGGSKPYPDPNYRG